MRKEKIGGLPMKWKVALVLLPFCTAMAALCVGRYSLSFTEISEVLFGRLLGSYEGSEMAYKTVWNLRIPRILLAMLVGAGLSVAGCTFQSLFANPLAAPDTLGIASGAGFGAALGILFGFGLLGIQCLSFFMGIAAVALTWLGGSGKGKGLSTVVLSGIMMGSLFQALLSFVKYVADAEDQLPSITYWLMGSFGSAGYRNLIFGAPVILTGILILYLIRWRMNLLPLSEDEIKASGTNLLLLRGITVVCATAVTASCVSMCGQVGWVGLLIPHMCRMKFGNDHRALIPASISLGASFMVITDTIARSLTAAEIPVSILTALIGAPFFVVLMRKHGGWQG